MGKSVALGCIPKSRHDVILAKLKGEFKVPIKQRTLDEVKALNLFRKRNDFLLDGSGHLLCHGKKIIVQEELPGQVERVFNEIHGCGSRVLYNKLKEKYTGFSEHSIIEILHGSNYFHMQYPRFTNKPLPKTIKASSPGSRWQIDIVSMKGLEICYVRKTYKYVLQIVDIYSRFIIPRPLKRKTSSEVASVLEKVMLDHGTPGIIQCDNGLEFQGVSMKTLLEKHNIKIIHGRPYYPQSQGKCERSNQILRRKIMFACRRKEGFNWVSGLQSIAHSINISSKRVLGNMSPFQVYYQRSHSHDAASLTKKAIKRGLHIADKSFRRRQLKGALRPSKYKIGEKVLLRYPFTKSRVPKKRHILSGSILDVKSTGRYHVEFKNINGQTVQQWIGVESITSLTLKKEKRKQRTVNKRPQTSQTARSMKQIHRARFYQVLNHDDNIEMVTHSVFDIGVVILLDPKPDGNCQFAAIRHQMQLHAIHKDECSLRKESVEHLKKNQSFYEDFVHEGSFDDYIKCMSKDGTYGDNVTLVALMREYNMQCLVLSAAGTEHSTLVSNDGWYDDRVPLITLGYFPENAGMHYLSLSIDAVLLEDFIQERVNFHQDQVPAFQLPEVTCHEPEVAIHEPEADFQEQQATLEIPEVANQEPEVANHEPEDANQEQQAAIEIPEDANQEPETANQESQDTLQEPETANPEPEAALQENDKILGIIEEQRAILISKRKRKIKASGAPFTFKLLPRLVQEIIIMKCFKRNPAERYVLEHTDRYFVELFNSMGIPKPRIYISPALIENVPHPVSVRYLLRHLGRNSAVIQEIKHVIKEPTWANAWLRLRISGISWYDIVDIYYARKWKC